MEEVGLAGKPVTAENISYAIAPRINAAGRMDSAVTALQLVLCEDEDRAVELAHKLSDINIQRQETEMEIVKAAQELEEKLFSCGFEVEELIPLDAGISKVVVGRIVEMEPQEGTHLTKCVVDCGEYGHDIRISTGAANKIGRASCRERVCQYV